MGYVEMCVIIVTLGYVSQVRLWVCGVDANGWKHIIVSLTIIILWWDSDENVDEGGCEYFYFLIILFEFLNKHVVFPFVLLCWTPPYSTTFFVVFSQASSHRFLSNTFLSFILWTRPSHLILLHLIFPTESVWDGKNMIPETCFKQGKNNFR